MQGSLPLNWWADCNLVQNHFRYHFKSVWWCSIILHSIHLAIQAKYNGKSWMVRSGTKCRQRSAIRRLFFHPAKFDNVKDEKISDYKTVSVAQSKNLLGQTTYVQLCRTVFFMSLEAKFFFSKKYCSIHTKNLHKTKLKKT